MNLGRRPHPVLIGGLAAGAVLTLTATLAPAQADGTDTGTADPGTAATVAGYDTAPSTYCGNGADISALTRGEVLHGWTVVDGTTPVEFTANVLEPEYQGIDARTDLVIVDAGDPTPGPGEGDPADMTLAGNAAIQRAGGIWEGMSGSPMYDAAGDLVGAISYGLSSGPSDVIGLTPYTSMQQYVSSAATGSTATASTAAPAARVPVTSTALAKRIAVAADVTTQQADTGFTPLSAQSLISGVSAQRLSRAAKAFAKTGAVHTSFDGATGGTAPAAPADATGPTGSSGGSAAPALTGGDNIAAMDVYGDVSEGGVGTVTAVCGDDLVAYGHPQDDTGTTSVALMTAEAIGVQDDSLDYPFKMSNNGDVVGEITGDHTTGISGTLGSGPAQTGTFTGTATYDGGKPVTLTSYSATPTYWADAAYYDLVGAGDVADQATIPGGATVTYTIKGVDRTGKAFTLHHEDRYADGMDIAGDSGDDLGNLVYAISGIRDVQVTHVTASASIDDDSDVWRLTSLEQHVGGGWVKAPGVVLARAGKTLRLRGVIEDKATGATRTVPISVPIKKGLSGAHGALQVTGGNSLFDFPDSFTTVAAAKSYVAGLVPHDALRVTTKLTGHGTEKSTTVTKRSAAVIGGNKTIMVIVR